MLAVFDQPEKFTLKFVCQRWEICTSARKFVLGVSNLGSLLNMGDQVT
jgi:hypothetical protein